MKIILCIFLLNITAVSVFGKELNGTLGQSIKFPATVKKGGSLIHSDVTIGDVTSGSFWTSRDVNYRDRVQWDSSTGLFSLSGLKMEDIGEYEVRNTDQNIITVFQLNVYKDNVPVSKPDVSITHNEYPCTIECTAERGTEVTLSWYREGEKKSFASSRVASAPHLHLPHSVESGTYTCEAKNSVSNEMASITVGDHCTAPADLFKWILIAVFVLLLLLAIVAYCLRRRILRFIRRRRGETILEFSPDAVRTLIQVNKLLKNVDPQACAFEGRRKGDAVQPVPQSAFEGRRKGDAVKTVPQSDIIRKVEGSVDKFVYYPDATKKITTSDETEVPLNQATCEVGDT